MTKANAIEPIDALLTGWAAPGVWALATAPVGAGDQSMIMRARGLGWWTITLEGVSASKNEFLAAVRRAAEFPDWVGNNWDAFEDAMTDLSWVPTSNVVLFVPAAIPDTAIDILLDVARFWDHHHRRFAVVVHGTNLDGRSASLPRLDQLPIIHPRT